MFISLQKLYKTEGRSDASKEENNKQTNKQQLKLFPDRIIRK